MRKSLGQVHGKRHFLPSASSRTLPFGPEHRVLTGPYDSYLVRGVIAPWKKGFRLAVWSVSTLD